MNASIKGLQEAQQAVVQMIAAVKPDNGLGRAVKYATIEAHRIAVTFTHVQTGSLRASQHMSVISNRGMVFIDPGAVNPRTRQKPSVYGAAEEGRGGSHAFYGRTVDQYERIGQAAYRGLLEQLP
jgi:hypothetical protein